jgi:hypothetical protein
MPARRKFTDLENQPHRGPYKLTKEPYFLLKFATTAADFLSDLGNCRFLWVTMMRFFGESRFVLNVILSYLMIVFIQVLQASAQISNGGEGGAVSPTVIPEDTETPDPPPCNPNVSSGVVNFEEFSEYANIAKEPHRSLMVEKYGIQFDAITGGDLAIAKVVSRGDSEPSFKAWLSVLCKGRPNNNRACNGGNVGKRVLSMTNAKSTRVAELSLTLVEPVQSLSFDILDVDGGETWTITATDKDGKPLPAQKVSAAGYGGSSNNNRAKNFQVKTLGKEIKSVRVRGTKNIKIFGFGFDNFVTGITPCK